MNTACQPGYFGIFCNQTCPFGYYGPKCGGTCFPVCMPDECDNVKGCLQNFKQTTKNPGKHNGKGTRLWRTILKRPTACKRWIDLRLQRTNILICSFVGKINAGTEYKELIYDSITKSVSVGRETHFIPEQSVPKSEINGMYLLLGFGTLLTIFLFIIAIQLIKNSKFAKRNHLGNQNLSVTNKSVNATLNELNHENTILYSRVENEDKPPHCYLHMNSEYHEIEECMESNGTLPFVSFGGQTIPLHQLPPSEFKRQNSDCMERKQIVYWLNNLNDKAVFTTTKHPMVNFFVILVLGKPQPAEIEDVHSYIDVTG